MLTPTTAEQDPNEMWDIYLDEVKEDDERISDAWKEDSNGILVFVSPNPLTLFNPITSSKTGLFAATVGAFILEFYKTLSPDSGNQTVALLEQISQQFSNFPNGTHSVTANQPFSPSAPMIWVNAMWLISLVLSLTSALIATLLQQWARRYKTPHLPGEPNHRARVRSFLFHGTESYKMRIVVQVAPTLLHLSVYLFFAGLVVLFHTINKNVAIAVDAAVGVFAVAYVVLSIIPCLDVSCPFRTPMSHILWYPLHVILFLLARFLHWFVEQLHGCLVQPGLDDDVTARQHILVNWLGLFEKAFKAHRQYIKDGLGQSIITCAVNTQEDGDHKIVTRLFNLLATGNKSKLRKFAASIPRDQVSKLIPLIESGRIVLRDSLRTLLRTFARSTRVTEPDEDVRKRSLLVCLDAIYYIAKNPEVPDLEFMRANYAVIGLMRDFWDDDDTAIRFTSRSICALLAKKVLKEALDVAQIRWLNEVTREQGLVYDSPIERDRKNLKSFLYGVFSKQVEGPPVESFKDTLAILLDVGDDDFETNFRNRLTEEVVWIRQQDPQGSREILDQLRLMFRYLPPPPPPLPPAPAAPPAPAFPSHHGVALVDPHSSLVAPPEVTVSLPTPQSAHSHTSNVPRGS